MECVELSPSTLRRSPGHQSHPSARFRGAARPHCSWSIMPGTMHTPPIRLYRVAARTMAIAATIAHTPSRITNGRKLMR